MMNKYHLDNFKRAQGYEAPPLDEAVTAKRNLLVIYVTIGTTLFGLALWGAWLIGLDTVFWGLTLVCTIILVAAIGSYLWDKAWDFGYWLSEQRKIVKRAKTYGVRDE